MLKPLSIIITSYSRESFAILTVSLIFLLDVDAVLALAIFCEVVEHATIISKTINMEMHFLII